MSLKQKIYSIFRHELVIDTVVVFLGNIVAAAFSLFYHIVCVRMLTEEDYGTFNALISFVMFSGVAISPLYMTLTRYFTEYITKKDFSVLIAIFVKIIRRLFIAAAAVFLLILAIAPNFAEFLKTQALYVIICGGIMALTLLCLPFHAIIWSFQRFKAYSFVWVAASLGKLVLGSILIYLGWRILGGLSGFLAGPILIILTALIFIPNIFHQEIGRIDIRDHAAVSLVPIYRYSFSAFITMLSFALLTSIDVIFVKHFFTPLDAGYYSIGHMVGKAVFFLPHALAIAIFPKCTEAFVYNRSSLKLLYKSLLLGGVCCLFIACLAFIFPDNILRILTGKVNPVSSSIVGLLSMAMGFYALLWITISFLMATHNLKFVLPLLLLAVFEAIFIYNWHPTLIAVVSTLLVFSVISFAISLWAVNIANKRPVNMKMAKA